MNIFNLLIKEEHVAGIEISDNFIRIAYFSPRKKVSKKINEGFATLPENELILIEEKIPENIIKEGVVIDKKLLGKTLKDIWTKVKINTNYAVVSIPENKIYSHIFSFPKSINEGESLKEAINLAIDFQFPVKKSESYISYENTENSHSNNEFLISSISKNIANDYIEALSYANIKILALESHLASIARSIKLKPEIATLFTKKSSSGTTVFILKDGTLYFSRMLPINFVKENDLLQKEISNIKTSFEADKKISVLELSLEKAIVQDEYLKYPEFNKLNPEIQVRWIVAIGAIIRGKIPREKDNYISLLPVGTAEAYEYQKKVTFITLIRNITISVSLFFLFTFLATYFFIFSLSQTINKTSSNIITSTIPPDMLQKEEWIKKINEMTSTSQIILSTTPMWDILLDDINSRVVDGTLISNFSVTSINDPISISGIAKDRNTLNQFKKSLQTSIYLTAVELPITNLELKGDIPFSISFRIKDPSMLYYK